MWPVIYVLGVLVTAFLCGWQIRSADEPMARWEAILITALWPVWFVLSWITVVMLGVPTLALAGWRKFVRVRIGG